MPLSPKERQALLAESHPLKAVATLSADAMTDAAIEHVRAAFVGRELLKVRIPADSGDECDAAAADLARRVPCELVKRVGRVAVLYRAAAPTSET
jgi:RNA-binding protein